MSLSLNVLHCHVAIAVDVTVHMVLSPRFAVLYRLLVLTCSRVLVPPCPCLDSDRTTHELLLKSLMILASIVPQHMPMQMAMAVNTALLALNKADIFCTEPFRVPVAGKVSHCLFDKTGTITTDQLVPIGVVCATGSARRAAATGTSSGTGSGTGTGSGSGRAASTPVTAAQQRAVAVGDPVQLTGLERAEMNGRTGIVVAPYDATVQRVTVAVDAHGTAPALTARFRAENLKLLVAEARALVPVRDATPEVSVVLAACHALVSVEGAGLVGDPIELAAMQVRWSTVWVQ
jgi:magnesium-transporting ATPase (P-type)